MNRTDRLYALVEELRAFAPRPRTAQQLAQRFEVSVRTIERDLNALLEAGVRSEVVAISYVDRDGKATTRKVEPIALIGWGQAWYLVGHCRLRDGQRAFRLDRIREARLTGESAPDRGEPRLDGIPMALRRLALLG